MSLENVRVQAKYPAKQTATGKWSRNILANDSSGSIKVSLWGAAAMLQINDGDVVTIKGTLKRGEYPVGTPQLSGEQGITIEGGSAQPSLGEATGPSQRQGGGAGDRDATIVRQNSLAHATALVIASGPVADVFMTQQLILDLAKVYAHYSMTGEAKQVEDSQPEYEEEKPF